MKNTKIYTKTFDLGNGQEVSIETGKLAKQADGAVVVKIGKTMLLATVVSTKEQRIGAGFLPLTVDYQEKFAASGSIPGGFLKRESRLSNYEILISRLIDRAIRPLFPKDYFSDIQVLISLISSDEQIIPDSYVALAASSAITISDIPFSGPISEVRVALINDEFVINPKKDELKNAKMDIIVAATEENVNMVEGGMDEVSEEVLAEAIKKGHEAIKIQCKAQKELREECGIEKREYEKGIEDDELKKLAFEKFEDKVKKIAETATEKDERSEALSNIWTEYVENLSEEELEDKDKLSLMKKYFGDVKKETIRKVVLENKTRLDGRKYDEIRNISCEVDYLPSAHGSAVFTRGETQSLTSVTFGSRLDEQMVDGAFYKGFEKFILHYNFPAFSTGEVKPNRGPARREIGHGNLAKRALERVLPSEDVNPYTIRIVSDILESNGSSSMATVCAGSLALMDAGVKIKKPVSGIAMGLIIDTETNKYAVLSDILGDEDHLGDMDFKVTGTEDGLTACQMDIKVEGLSYEILSEALQQAKRGRMHILEKMKEAIVEPRQSYKEHAPQIEKILVEEGVIGKIIGPGGKQIQQIQKDTNAKITIGDPVNGKATVEIVTPTAKEMKAAKATIEQITAKPEEGKIYDAKVVSVVDFGAFLEFMPGNEGLLHNSEYSYDRSIQTNKMVKKGDIVKVKLINIDQRSGKFRLSRKILEKK